MSISFVQAAALGETSNAASQQSLAFGSNPTVGNYLVAWAWGWDGTHTKTSCTFTDSAGGTSWITPSGAFQTINNDLWCSMAYTKVANSGASFKVTAAPVVTSGTFGGPILVCAAEFSGVSVTSPLDGAAVGTAPGTTAQTYAPGSMNFTTGSLVVSVMSDGSGLASSVLNSPGAPWVSAGKNIDGNNFQVGEGMYQINATSPINPTWTTTDAAKVWAASQFALLVDVPPTVLVPALIMLGPGPALVPIGVFA